MDNFELVVKKLIENNETVSTMESCTGGQLASEITNIPGASEVLKFSAVTYSNEFKIKMGVSEDVIDKYSVYSFETAKEMSKNISDFSHSTYGIGVTGKINRQDIENPQGETDEVFVSIYNSKSDEYILSKIKCPYKKRKQVKIYIASEAVKQLTKIL